MRSVGRAVAAGHRLREARRQREAAVHLARFAEDQNRHFFTGAFMGAVEQVAATARSGPEIEALLERTQTALPAFITEAVEITAEQMKVGHAGLIQELRRDGRRLQRSVYQVWGPAHDALEVYAYGIWDLTAPLSRETRQRKFEATWNALSDLHARALRTTAEILHLARGGLPSGADARWRSLHELAVVARVLSDATEEHGDGIAHRFHAYSVIEQCKDIQFFNAVETKRGGPLVEEPDLFALKDELVEQFGKSLTRENGWARPLFIRSKSDVGIRFVELEGLAALDHLRPRYRYGNHYIHAGSRAGVLNSYETDEGSVRSVGATVYGDQAETCHAAAVSLQRVTDALLSHNDGNLDLDLVASSKALRDQVWGDLARLFNDAAKRSEDRREFSVS